MFGAFCTRKMDPQNQVVFCCTLLQFSQTSLSLYQFHDPARELVGDKQCDHCGRYLSVPNETRYAWVMSHRYPWKGKACNPYTRTG